MSETVNLNLMKLHSIYKLFSVALLATKHVCVKDRPTEREREREREREKKERERERTIKM